MLKLAITHADGSLYALGLSDRNIELLRQGKPIVVDLAELGGQGRVMLFAGATEDAMLADLRAAGLVPADAATTKND